MPKTFLDWGRSVDILELWGEGGDDGEGVAAGRLAHLHRKIQFDTPEKKIFGMLLLTQERKRRRSSIMFRPRQHLAKIILNMLTNMMMIWMMIMIMVMMVMIV